MPEENSNAIADGEETIVETSATSHLRNVKVSDPEAEPADELSELPKVALPKTLKLTLEALEAARKETDARVRTHRIRTLTNRLHALSQGPQAPDINGKNFSTLAKAQNNSAEVVHIEMLGRQFPVVKKWLAAANAEIDSLKSELAAANAIIETLKNPTK